MKHNKILKSTFLLGIILLMMSVIMQIIGTKAEQNLAKGFFTPIIAFEFIQNQTQVLQFFNVQNPEQYKIDMHLGNKLDYMFMLIYSLFIFLSGYYLYIKNKNIFFVLIMILSPIALITDALENIQIHYILNDISGNIDTFLKDLKLYTWLKWGSLTFVFLIFGIYFLKIKKWFFGIIAVLPLTIMPIAFFSYNIINEIFAMCIVFNFLILFIFVILEYKKHNTIINN